MIRQDNTAEIKGGILIYIKDGININENKVINNLSADFEESRWVELEVSGTKVIFGTVYRKGKSTASNNKQLLKIIEKAANIYKKVIICGDMNFPEINWTTYSVDALTTRSGLGCRPTLKKLKLFLTTSSGQI